MDPSTIRRLIDGIDTALGPDARSAQVEEIAKEMLSGMTSGRVARAALKHHVERVSPHQIIVHVRVDDCSSRLASTVVSHCYDKIRRLTSEIPDKCRSFFDKRTQVIPHIELRVWGADQLVKGFQASECIEILSHIAAAGADVAFDRSNLLTVYAGKSGSAAYLLPILSDLISSCAGSGFEIEIGSLRTGLRAAELLDVARVALTPGAEDTHGGRFILSCNTPGLQDVFQSHRGDIKLDLCQSIWPRIAEEQDRLPIGACYTDRFGLLGETGRSITEEGNASLAELVASLNQESGTDAEGSIQLSLDAPGGGPLSAAIWTGLPIEVSQRSGAEHAAAILFREGLLSELASRNKVTVTADGHPVSNTIRNVRQLSAGLTDVGLAGYLVKEFSGTISSSLTKKIHLLSDQAQSSDSVEIIKQQPGWNEGHFTIGGALIPPAS